MSGFIVYLIIYYSKYFQGNFFFNYALQGFSDCFSLLYVAKLTALFNSKTSLVKTLKLLVVVMIFLTLIQMLISESGIVD
jgi:hypothetical protein